MKTKITILIIGIVFLFSCDKDLEYSYPEAPKKLVIHSIFSPDSVWSVGVNKLQHTLNKIDSLNYFVPDATVKLYKNGEYLETLVHTNTGNYKSAINTKPEEDTDYYIEVSAEGYDTAISETERVPEQATGKLITYVDYFDKDLFQFFDEWDYIHLTSTYTVELNFTNNLIEFDAWMKFVNSFFVSSIKSEANFKYGGRDDIKINEDINKSLQITFALYWLNSYDCCNCFYENIMFVNQVDFYIYSISESYYNYYNDESYQSSSLTDVFLSTQNIYTNINNGLGIFAGKSKPYIIKLPAKPIPEGFLTINCH